MPADVVLASNRGPLAFTLGDDGALHAGRGGGGLVAGLSGGTSGTWVCAALSDGDRRAVEQAPGGKLPHPDGGDVQIRMLEIEPGIFTRAYGSVANSTLWFLHHLLLDTARQPVFDLRFHRDWLAYCEYNAAFADAVADEAAPNARVLVQDYHLSLVPRLLRTLRPDLRVGHFSHTPWAPPAYFRMLPDDLAAQLLLGLLGADRAGFLSPRWARAFAQCCSAVLGAEVSGLDGDGPILVRHDGRTTAVDVHALGVDGPGLQSRAAKPDVLGRLAVLREQVGPRQALVRVDRTELSKNIVRGLLAYEELLESRPEWRERVVHIAFAYPSRQDLAVYRDYTAEVERVATDVNSRYGTADWTPVELHVKDDFARSLAAYRLADVALVNPIRDGMNLVAKEVPVVSDEGCALVLSREAGAFEELAEDAVPVNPYDIGGMAAALHQALSMGPGERAERTKRLAAQATALPPARWFLEQLAALEG
jgi:trehalose 6-phosphate synthase